MEFFDENDYGHVPDWDDAYFEDETSFSNFGAAQVGDQSDLDRGQVTSNGKYQNTFTITEM